MENELSKEQPIQTMKPYSSLARLPGGDNWESSSLDGDLHRWVHGDLVQNTQTIVWKTKNQKNPFLHKCPRY